MTITYPSKKKYEPCKGRLKKSFLTHEEAKEHMNQKMKGILVSILTLGIAATLLGTGTVSYLNDIETSFDNTIAAGMIDLKVDCDKSTHWYDGVIQDEIVIPEKDLAFGDRFFNWNDVKPGDSGEATLSFHVYDNDAWLWFQICNIWNVGGAHPEPEQHVDPNNDGNLADNIMVRIWWDDGDNEYEPASEDLMWPTDSDWGTAEDALTDFSTIQGPYAMTASTTYYVGVEWKIPFDVGNEIQGDSLTFDLSFYAEQQRNNDGSSAPASLCGDDTVIEECYLNSIELRVLDGLAGQENEGANDDFKVYIDDNMVYEHTGTADTDGEHWLDHGPIQIEYLGLDATVPHTIKIECISGEEWQSFGTYGQLGVDWVEITSTCGQSELIDIGGGIPTAWVTPSGWGPTEPDTNGGNWGGFNGDCRVTWYDNGDTQNPDGPCATLEFTLP